MSEIHMRKVTGSGGGPGGVFGQPPEDKVPEALGDLSKRGSVAKGNLPAQMEFYTLCQGDAASRSLQKAQQVSTKPSGPFEKIEGVFPRAIKGEISDD